MTVCHTARCKTCPRLLHSKAHVSPAVKPVNVGKTSTACCSQHTKCLTAESLFEIGLHIDYVMCHALCICHAFQPSCSKVHWGSSSGVTDTGRLAVHCRQQLPFLLPLPCCSSRGTTHHILRGPWPISRHPIPNPCKSSKMGFSSVQCPELGKDWVLCVGNQGYNSGRSQASNNYITAGVGCDIFTIKWAATTQGANLTAEQCQYNCQSCRSTLTDWIPYEGLHNWPTQHCHLQHQGQCKARFCAYW